MHSKPTLYMYVGMHRHMRHSKPTLYVGMWRHMRHSKPTLCVEKRRHMRHSKPTLCVGMRSGATSCDCSWRETRHVADGLVIEENLEWSFIIHLLRLLMCFRNVTHHSNLRPYSWTMIILRRNLDRWLKSCSKLIEYCLNISIRQIFRNEFFIMKLSVIIVFRAQNILIFACLTRLGHPGTELC